MSEDMHNNGASQILAGLLQARTGQIIAPNRQYRIETALKPVLQAFCIPDMDTLVAALLGADNEDLVQSAVEAMLNNESYFFRDQAMFGILHDKVLPVLKERRTAKRSLRIWCAGCSTGQEIYSLAMQLSDERTQWAGWNIELLGTDISESVLEKARSGRFTQFEIQRGLSVTHMLRYFRQDGEDWVIKPEIRAMIDFRSDNIVRPARQAGEFDLILCRNVLLYFSPETRHMAFSRIGRSLAPDGYLMLGAAETVIGQTTSFVASDSIRGVYRLMAGETEKAMPDNSAAYAPAQIREHGEHWPFARRG